MYVSFLPSLPLNLLTVLTILSRSTRSNFVLSIMPQSVNSVDLLILFVSFSGRHHLLFGTTCNTCSVRSLFEKRFKRICDLAMVHALFFSLFGCGSHTSLFINSGFYYEVLILNYDTVSSLLVTCIQKIQKISWLEQFILAFELVLLVEQITAS